MRLGKVEISTPKTTRSKVIGNASSSGERPYPQLVPREKYPHFFKSAIEMLPTLKIFEPQCQIPANEKPEWLLQSPRLGQMVSLPNPSAEMGFQLKPSFAHRALLQIQFSNE
jgi:hypothetical protein